MYYSDRFDKILEILEAKKQANVTELSRILNVSEQTTRRDLRILEEQGLVRRTYGGVILRQTIKREVPLQLRERENILAKDNIAKRAVSYVHDGNVIFMDASSTVSYLIPYLKDFSDLTVITNSPKHSLELARQDTQVYCTGGLLLKDSIAYVGTYAENFVRNFNADVFFFSSRGLTHTGIISDSSIEESELRRIMMSCADRSVFMCASNKVGRRFMYNLCRSSDVDDIICDRELPSEIKYGE